MWPSCVGDKSFFVGVRNHNDGMTEGKRGVEKDVLFWLCFNVFLTKL